MVKRVVGVPSVAELGTIIKTNIMQREELPSSLSPDRFLIFYYTKTFSWRRYYLSSSDSVTLSLFCATLEREVSFRKLQDDSLKRVIKFRENTVFFTEYARLVIYAVLGKELADKVWGGNQPNPQKGGPHALFELYWISSIINPTLSWALKTNQVERTSVKTEPQQDKVAPKKQLLGPLAERLPQIEKFLKANVVGQPEALETVMDVLYRNAAGLSEPTRPLSVLLFTGPSGVGKSLLAKALTVALMEEKPNKEHIANPQSFFRIDCTLYQQKHEISNLIGSPRGYVGSDLGSPLPDFLKANLDGNVVLIDEVEKASPSLHKMFMGLFDHGMIKDNNQVEASARNTVFIMTSNAGSREASKVMDSATNSLGFAPVDVKNISNLTERAYRKKLEEIFPPEFRGRVDESIVFKSLDETSCRKILDLEICRVEERLKEKNISLVFTEVARQNIIKEGFSPTLGARKLSQVLREQVIKKLSRLIVSSSSRAFVVRGRDGTIKVEEK
jgi:ATP-dependent Clp protease ATP-binding subunit ClpA